MTSGPSLQRRLLVGALSVVLLLWCLTAAYVWWQAAHEVDELLDAHLAQSAALLVAQGAHGVVDDDGDAIDPELLRRRARHVIFQVWHEGKLISSSPETAREPLSPVEEGFGYINHGGNAWRLYASHAGEADLQVYVAERLSARSDIVQAIVDGLLLPAVFMLPLAALAVWWVVRKGLAPLRTLSGTLAHRTPESLEKVSLPGEAPVELKPLMLALNQLFDRIALLLDSERRFTADAAHELRTPIAAIRAHAQVALGAVDEVPRLHALQSTLAGCDRATHLVEQLLTLSRLEASAPGGAAMPADLPQVVQRVVADLAPTALARQQTISLEAPGHCLVAVNDALAGVLVRNLVDNALRYSPDHATVRVWVDVIPGSQVVLHVEDSGPGMDAESIRRLGERFFRVLGNDAPGSGLGWSIVRRIAKVQGAQIGVQRSGQLGGLSVTVSWPITSD